MRIGAVIGGWRPWPRRLRQRAVLLSVVASFVVIAVALAVASTWVDRRNSLARSERNAVNTARLLEEHADATLDTANVMLAYLADRISGIDDPAAIGARFATWQRIEDLGRAAPQLGTVWVFGPDGRLLFASAPQPPPPADLPEIAYFATPGQATRAVRIGRLHEGADTGAYFTITKGVEIGGGTGVVSAALSSDYFRSFYRGLDVGRESFVTLMHREGAVIATQWPSRLAGKPALLDMVGEQPDGVRWAGHDDDRYVVAWRQLGDAPLVVLAALAESDALAEWSASLRRNGLLGLAAMVILAVITQVALLSLQREEASRAQLNQALREKEMLFKELHHRVKNNLQVVTSLIMMQSLRFPQPELQQSFQQTMDRVRAMGLVHELLYQQEHSDRLHFGNYLAALCRSLGDSQGAAARGIEIACHPAEAEIDLHLAIPAGLIVNELLTNALKYAFPDGRNGRIDIAFSRDDGTCRLEISDNGIGADPEKPAKGTGLGTLIVKNLAAQLSATYSVTSAPEAGTRVSLLFPCPT